MVVKELEVAAAAVATRHPPEASGRTSVDKKRAGGLEKPTGMTEDYRRGSGGEGKERGSSSLASHYLLIETRTRSSEKAELR